MKEKEGILLTAKRRGIEHCIHFTNARNIPNILSYGLLPVDKLEDNWIEYSNNDDLRLDNLSNSISLSITSPNYKMFYKLRCEYPQRRWVVLVLDAEMVLGLDCAFCKTNAANTTVSSVPIEERKTLQSFEGMFGEFPDQVSRLELGLCENEVTDPQAEILVFDSIPPSAIQFAFFNDIKTMEQYGPILTKCGIPYTRDLGYYYPRRDYSFW